MNPSLASVIFTVGRVRPEGLQILGTGFAVGPHKIATTAHSTEQNDKDLVVCIPHIQRLDEYQDTTDTNWTAKQATICAYDPLHDIAVLDVPGFTMSFSYTLGSTDEAPPGTSIVSAGFPHADWGRRVLTQQTSTVGARMLMAAGPLKAKHIVMNTQTRPGTSGSPVFLNGQDRVCAMVIGSYAPQGGGGISLGGIDPTTLHQTTHAVSAEYIARMI